MNLFLGQTVKVWYSAGAATSMREKVPINKINLGVMARFRVQLASLAILGGLWFEYRI